MVSEGRSVEMRAEMAPVDLRSNLKRRWRAQPQDTREGCEMQIARKTRKRAVDDHRPMIVYGFQGKCRTGKATDGARQWELREVRRAKHASTAGGEDGTRLGSARRLRQLPGLDEEVREWEEGARTRRRAGTGRGGVQRWAAVDATGWAVVESRGL